MNPCPNCGKLYKIGPYRFYKDEKGQVRTAPDDIVCECGAVLRVIVPIFKITDNGYVLEIIQPDKKRTTYARITDL